MDLYGFCTFMDNAGDLGDELTTRHKTKERGAENQQEHAQLHKKKNLGARSTKKMLNQTPHCQHTVRITVTSSTAA